MSNSVKSDKAIALQYKEDETLPRVTAVGSNLMAERIIALAKEYDVPIYQDETLTNLIDTVGVGQQIPQESIELLADMLAFLYHVDQCVANS